MVAIRPMRATALFHRHNERIAECSQRSVYPMRVRSSGIARFATSRARNGREATNSSTATNIAKKEAHVRRCDNCQELTEVEPNLEDEVLCSDVCQHEYGITSLLSLMRYSRPRKED